MHIVVIGAGRGLMQTLKAVKPVATQLTVVTPSCAHSASDALIRRLGGFVAATQAFQVLHQFGGDAQMQRLWGQRFASLGTPYDGVPFGILHLLAHAQQLGSMQEALALLQQQIRCSVDVFLVSETVHDVLLHQNNGDVVRHQPGQSVATVTQAELTPAVQVNPAVIRALRVAQLVVIAPGSLYTTVLPALLPSGMADTLRSMTAQVVCVTPLTTVAGQTDAFRCVDYVARVARTIGRGGLDTALVNNATYSVAQRAVLTKHGVAPLLTTAGDGEIVQALGVRMVARDFLMLDGDAEVAVSQLTTHHETELRMGCVQASRPAHA
jgi:uncharacterized cofD-like protein